VSDLVHHNAVKLSGLAPEHPCQSRLACVHRPRQALKRADRESDRRVLEGDLEALLRVHPRQFCAPNLRDVSCDADEALDSRTDDHGAHREQHLDLGAILAHVVHVPSSSSQRTRDETRVGRDTSSAARAATSPGRGDTGVTRPTTSAAV